MSSGTATADQRKRAEAALLRMGLVALPALHDYLRDDTVTIATTAAKILGKINDSSAIPSLVQALYDNTHRHPYVNIAAAEALGNLKHLSAVPPLIQVYQWRSSDLRQEAIRALEKIGHPTAVPLLIIALEDSSSDVRAAAADALGNILSPAALPALTRASRDPSSEVAERAESALVRLKAKLAEN